MPLNPKLQKYLYDLEIAIRRLSETYIELYEEEIIPLP